MIIGIDISATAYGTGVSNYTLNLIKELIKIDKINHYKLFFSSLRLPISPEIVNLAKKSNVTLFHYKIPPTALHFLWNKLHLIPIEYFIGKCDIFHCSDWTQPPTLKAKTITTIHDLAPFLYPQWQHPTIIRTHKAKMYWAVKECHHFICVSQNTKKDLTLLFPKISPSKISVIYEAAESKYAEFAKLSSTVQQQKIKKISQQYGLNRFILVQGTREPRKNLSRLIEAFDIYRSNHPGSKVEMAITGKYGWGENLAINNHWIKVLGYIPEKDMTTLHAAALFLAYPSLYEGFGLPVVKSLSVGVPVLTSNTSSLPEVIGKAGLLVDPNSTDSIYQGLLKMLSSTSYRQILKSKCLKQASLFSWKNTAKNTLHVYSQI